MTSKKAPGFSNNQHKMHSYLIFCHQQVHHRLDQLCLIYFRANQGEHGYISIHWIVLWEIASILSGNGLSCKSDLSVFQIRLGWYLHFEQQKKSFWKFFCIRLSTCWAQSTAWLVIWKWKVSCSKQYRKSWEWKCPKLSTSHCWVLCHVGLSRRQVVKWSTF